EETYGKEAVTEGGFRVITTLDYELQKKAEEIVKKWALQNEERFNAENAALVATDPRTGQILAMVGSRDYFDTEIEGNFNVATARRQPGSAFKPFVYAAAFQKGYTPETVLFDLQTEFSVECTPEGKPYVEGNEDRCYKPENYDQLYIGPVTLRSALAESRNVPSVKTLYLAGLKESLRLAREIGITTLGSPGQYGLTLVLGGGEVTLLEMVGAYGVFANDGERNSTVAILRIEDKAGAVVGAYEPRPTRTLSADIARNISSILSDEEARAPTFGRGSYLYFKDRAVGVKTGTTNDYRDAWIIGYTPSLAVGAWAGNNDNTPMEKKVAGFIVAPLWHEFMEVALAGVEPERFAVPPRQKIPLEAPPVLRGVWQGGKNYFVDRVSGKRATEYTPPETLEERVVREVHTILHWVNKDAPLQGNASKGAGDSQYERWEFPIRAWAAAQGVPDETEAVIPSEEDSVHGPFNAPVLSLSGLTAGSAHRADETIPVTVTSTGRFPLGKVDFFVGGVYVGSAARAPFTFSFKPKDVEALGEQAELRVIGYDTVFNKRELVIPFSVTP
ncbi:MAG: penicillin-binding protein, partial [Parcubacteria group bacterium Gr01-1014_72]